MSSFAGSDWRETFVGVSVLLVRGFVGVSPGAEAFVGGGLVGVLIAETVGVEVDAAGAEKLRFSLTSPYSFHSSTCSKS